MLKGADKMTVDPSRLEKKPAAAIDSPDLHADEITSEDLEIIAGGTLRKIDPTPGGCPPGLVVTPFGCAPPHP
jgi:hypothetical protein